jgi:serine/threonine protein kinase
MISDFGLAKILCSGNVFTNTTSSSMAGTARWTAPELLNPDEFGLENSNPSVSSDIYALGMVILEVRITCVLAIPTDRA